MGSPLEFFVGNGFPGSWIFAGRQSFHRNTAVDRTHTDTKIAANTFRVDNLEVSLAIDRMSDCLMRGVLTDHVAAPALDAEVLVDNGFFNIVEVQVLPFGNAGNGLSHQLIQR